MSDSISTYCTFLKQHIEHYNNTYLDPCYCSDELY